MEAALVSPYGRTPLGATKITIGRASDNTIVVNDLKASSHHAEIRPEGQYYSLVDLGSMNGTFVNEQQVYGGTPRPLSPGDSIRIGDTRFTFEASNTGQNPYYEDSTVQAVPPPPVMPNYAGNTSYGMGNYGSQPNYPPTEFAQPQQYSAPAYSDPYSVPPAQQPPYSSETQVPTYISSPYGSSGGQTAPPPNYPPQPQTQLSGYTPPAPEPQPRRSAMRTIVLAVIALVIILAAIGSFLLISHNNQVAQQNATATTTARNHTATAQAIAQQTAQAQATITAEKQSHYPPFTKVALFDTLVTTTSTWDSNSICQFSSSSYTISIQQAHTLQYCLNNSQQYSEIAYQVTMTVQQGDCGGLVFRFVDGNNFYYVDVCQDGTYDLGDYVNGTQNLRYNNTQASSTINQGTGKQNVIAITVQGDTVNLFINGHTVDTVTSQALTSSTFSQGKVGLLADDLGNPTAVSYTNALVWTSGS